MDHLYFLWLVFLLLLRLFIAALWSPAGKGLSSWRLLVMFFVFLLLFHVVSWVRCGTGLYRFLIFAVFLLCILLGGCILFCLSWDFYTVRQMYTAYLGQCIQLGGYTVCFESSSNSVQKCGWCDCIENHLLYLKS